MVKLMTGVACIIGAIVMILGGIAGVGGDPTPFLLVPLVGWLTVGMAQSAAIYLLVYLIILLLIVSFAHWINNNLG